jgi:hypothetical protein
MLCHKPVLTNKTEIFPGLFSNHSGMELGISNIKNFGTVTNMQELNNTSEQPMSGLRRNEKKNLKVSRKRDMVTQSYNSITQESEIGGLRVQGQPGHKASSRSACATFQCPVSKRKRERKKQRKKEGKNKSSSKTSL